MAYILFAVAKLEYENYLPGYDQLQSYHAEYEHGGSNRWRFLPQQKDFHHTLLLYGLPVYLASFAVVIISMGNILTRKPVFSSDRLIYSIFLLMALAVLVVYIQQGVLSAALEQG